MQGGTRQSLFRLDHPCQSSETIPLTPEQNNKNQLKETVTLNISKQTKMMNLGKNNKSQSYSIFFVA